LRLGDPQANPKISIQLTFKVNSATLTGEAKSQLDVVAEALQQEELANSNIVISGHTDASGNADKNRILSQRRAESVKLYLATHKVAAGRLTAVGRGSEELLDDANPRSPINRRVELALAP
jgi:outer membrane protein OmpA-like peptidoglycan-associated protein